jgi:O-antigen ligase
MSFLLLALIFLAIATTQALAGGRDIILCVPGYVLLAIASVLSWWPRRRHPIPRGAGECLAATAVFCGYIVGRAFWSPEEYLARQDLFQALSALVVYLVVALNVTSSKRRFLLVAGLLVLALANCLIGAIQTFKAHNFAPIPFLLRPDYGWRASGFYGYPNHLAGFLEMSLMLGLGAALWSRWPGWARILAGYVCAMCGLTILFTGSRSGYIATAVALLVFALLSLVLFGKLGSGRVIPLFAVGVALIGGGAWGVKQVLSRSALVQSRVDTTLTVDVSRIRLWQAAWKEFRLQPVVGTGSGTYLYYGRQFRSPGINRDPVNAHNDYFELLAEYGLLGIIAAVIFLETHLRRGWNSFRERMAGGPEAQGMRSNSLALTVGALAAAAACMVHCGLDFTLHNPANALMVAFVFALLSNPGEPSASQADEEPGWPAFLRLALPAIGVFLAVKTLPTARAEYDAERAHFILADWHRSVSPDLDIELEALARRGLQWDPRNPELHFMIGEANSTQGDLAKDPAVQAKFDEKSVEAYSTALALAPGDVRFVLSLGRALDNLRRFSESDPLFDRALQLDPKGGATRCLVGHHYLEQGKLAEAESEFHLAFKLGDWEAAQAGLANVEKLQKEQSSTPSPPPEKPEPK